MTPIHSFATEAATWQNFYLLCGTAAATLVGLMFVAVAFGATIVTPKTAASARAFLDPTVTHFVQVLVTACLMTIPLIVPTLVGVLLLVIGALRTVALRRVFTEMREANRVHHDIELSDWLTGIVVPLTCHAVLAASGVAFLAGYAAGFSGLAIATIATLLNGIYGAWELMLWMAFVRSQTK